MRDQETHAKRVVGGSRRATHTRPRRNRCVALVLGPEDRQNFSPDRKVRVNAPPESQSPGWGDRITRGMQSPSIAFDQRRIPLSDVRVFTILVACNESIRHPARTQCLSLLVLLVSSGAGERLLICGLQKLLPADRKSSKYVSENSNRELVSLRTVSSP
jgi:hypothetical protein